MLQVKRTLILLIPVITFPLLEVVGENDPKLSPISYRHHVHSKKENDYWKKGGHKNTAGP